MANTYILGLSMNTRCTGLALLNGYSLIDYRVRLNKEKWSGTKLQNILTNLQSWCTHYSIECVVLSSPYVYHQTKEMETLFQAVQAFFQKKNITLRSYTISEILSGWNIHQKKAKKAVLKETITEVFPELTSLVLKDSENSSVYYAKLFEAVGTALYHVQTSASIK